MIDLSLKKIARIQAGETAHQMLYIFTAFARDWGGLFTLNKAMSSNRLKANTNSAATNAVHLNHL